VKSNLNREYKIIERIVLLDFIHLQKLFNIKSYKRNAYRILFWQGSPLENDQFKAKKEMKDKIKNLREVECVNGRWMDLLQHHI
jgi:hypothetical protein